MSSALDVLAKSISNPDSSPEYKKEMSVFMTKVLLITHELLTNYCPCLPDFLVVEKMVDDMASLIIIFRVVEGPAFSPYSELFQRVINGIKNIVLLRKPEDTTSVSNELEMELDISNCLQLLYWPESLRAPDVENTPDFSILPGNRWCPCSSCKASAEALDRKPESVSSSLGDILNLTFPVVPTEELTVQPAVVSPICKFVSRKGALTGEVCGKKCLNGLEYCAGCIGRAEDDYSDMPPLVSNAN